MFPTFAQSRAVVIAVVAAVIVGKGFIMTEVVATQFFASRTVTVIV